MQPPPDSQDERAAIVDAFIKKRKTVQDAWEALGLTSEILDTRSAKFFKKEPNVLQAKIEQIAKSFLADYRGDSAQLHSDLAEETLFSEKVSKLGQQYGTKVWDRLEDGEIRSSSESQGKGIDKHDWDVPKDRENILFFMRCWIIRIIAGEFKASPRKEKGKVRTQDSEPPQNIDKRTGLECLPESRGPDSPDVLFRAPEPPRIHSMPYTPKEATVAARVDEGIRNTSSNLATTATLKATGTTSNKRKALDFHEKTPNAKLPKISKGVRATSVHRPGEHRDPYSSPTLPLLPSMIEHLPFGERGYRTSMQDPDRKWLPRETTVDTATIVGDDDASPEEIDSILQSEMPIASKESVQYEHQSHCVAGPSGTYQKHTRRDLLIPSDTQSHGHVEQADKELLHTNAVLSEKLTGNASNNATNRSLISHGSDPTARQQREYRRELFKLLVSYLNGINQFSPEAYDFNAEERMNLLLNQFWVNDMETLQTTLGDDAARLRIALESWMGMRHRLSQFRSTSGYFGRPGEQWTEYLRRMDDVSCARAMLAFVDLQCSARNGGECGYVAEMFDVDLTVVFDGLTRVNGCNGPEAFRSVRRYNDALLEWFGDDDYDKV